MDELEIAEIVHRDAREMAFAIRRAVFCAEQGVDPEEEFDGLDSVSRLYLARLHGEPVGTARLRFPESDTARIERVAVLLPCRRRGIGAVLTRRLMEDARAAGARRIELHAQTHAEAFYARHGFVARGGVFTEAGIPHVTMVWPGEPDGAPEPGDAIPP